MASIEDQEERLQTHDLFRLADFLNEVGMLKKTPRSGYAFLGSGKENVAEHSFRTTVIGFILAKLHGISPDKVLKLCLFHDLHEARTGDLNYLNQRYDTCYAKKALEDAVGGTGLAEELMAYWDELEKGTSLEAKLAHDADQLDMICNLNFELKMGNEFARDWLDNALPRLKTAGARELAEAILKSDPNHWWFETVPKSWWINRDKN